MSPTYQRGTSSFSGIEYGLFVDNETPTGTIDGANNVFTLAHTPDPVASLELYLNGAFQTAGEDYILSSGTITFINAPVSSSIIRCSYRY